MGLCLGPKCENLCQYSLPLQSLVCQLLVVDFASAKLIYLRGILLLSYIGAACCVVEDNFLPCFE